MAAVCYATDHRRLRLEPSPAGKDEVYCILGGRGELTLEGEVSEVGPGDAILIRNGHSRALRTLGDEDLVILVVFPKRPSDP